MMGGRGSWGLVPMVLGLFQYVKENLQVWQGIYQ